MKKEEIVATHWIGGRWIDAGEHRDSINPADGSVIGSFASAGVDEAQLAVDAALEAFRTSVWKEDRLLQESCAERDGN